MSNRDVAVGMTGGELRVSEIATKEAEEAARVGGVIHGASSVCWSIFSPQLGTNEGEAQDREEEDSLHV